MERTVYSEKEDALYALLREKILTGAFGSSGSPFPQARSLAAEYHVSTGCAIHLMRRLSAESLLLLLGKHYYVTTGRFLPGSPGWEVLSHSDPPMLGAVANGVGNPFFAEILFLLSQEALQAGYRMLILDDGGNEHDTLLTLLKLGVHGVFFFPGNPDHLDPFRRFVLPTVAIGKRISGLNCDTVCTDNFLAGHQVAAHLIETGCRSFCYVGLSHNTGTDLRYSGFSTRLSESGFPLPYEIFVSSAEDDALIPKLRTVLRSAPRPLGIFCYHDLLALKIHRFIKAGSVPDSAVPDDIKIVGFDDLPATLSVTPTLTTVYYNYHSIAEHAMEKMIRRLREPMAAEEEIMIPPALIVRGST